MLPDPMDEPGTPDLKESSVEIARSEFVGQGEAIFDWQDPV